VEKIKTHILYSIHFFSDNRVVYEVMWRSIVETERPQITIWRMRIAVQITSATNTLTEYVTLNYFSTTTKVAVRTSVVRYTYIANLVLCTRDGSLYCAVRSEPLCIIPVIQST
jgi:hypothetical protein